MITDKPSTEVLSDLLTLMATLRDPVQGCPWDKQQSMTSISSYTIEEVYEVVDAIEQQDWQALKEELGDLLFHIIYFAQIAKEQSLFDFLDVMLVLQDKLIRRHPHVFGDKTINDVHEVRAAWEAIKSAEREEKLEDSSVLSGLAKSLPALIYADKLQRRAKNTGFDWPDISGVFDKLQEEISEVQEALQNGEPEAVKDEVGDLLFTCVNLARFCKVDAETALRAGSDKFERRFRLMELRCKEQGYSFDNLTLTEMESLWAQAKQALACE